MNRYHLWWSQSPDLRGVVKFVNRDFFCTTMLSALLFLLVKIFLLRISKTCDLWSLKSMITAMFVFHCCQSSKQTENNTWLELGEKVTLVSCDW